MSPSRPPKLVEPAPPSRRRGGEGRAAGEHVHVEHADGEPGGDGGLDRVRDLYAGDARGAGAEGDGGVGGEAVADDGDGHAARARDTARGDADDLAADAAR